MAAIITLLVFGILILTYSYLPHKKKSARDDLHPKVTSQLNKLMDVATTAIKEKKTYRAEKALLTILRFDEKNAVAYNRLGILYAKEHKYDEAIECFEIANGIEINPASIHNIGTIYYETEEYEKAAIYFTQAIELEGDSPSYYTALAKAELKLGQNDRAVSALESAFDIQPSVALLRNIRQIYETMENIEAIDTIDKRIEALNTEIESRNQPKRPLGPTKHLRIPKPTRMIKTKPKPSPRPTAVATASTPNAPTPKPAPSSRTNTLRKLTKPIKRHRTIE